MSSVSFCGEKACNSSSLTVHISHISYHFLCTTYRNVFGGLHLPNGNIAPGPGLPGWHTCQVDPLSNSDLWIGVMLWFCVSAYKGIISHPTHGNIGGEVWPLTIATYKICHGEHYDQYCHNLLYVLRLCCVWFYCGTAIWSQDVRSPGGGLMVNIAMVLYCYCLILHSKQPTFASINKAISKLFMSL